MHCILCTYLQLPTAMPMCPSTPLWRAIGCMIFVARGNTYYSFVLLVDSLNGSKLLDWLGHQSSSLLFFLVFVFKVQTTNRKSKLKTKLGNTCDHPCLKCLSACRAPAWMSSCSRMVNIIIMVSVFYQPCYVLLTSLEVYPHFRNK